MKNIGYIRVSTDKQDLNNQKLAILEYASKREMKIHKFVKTKVSSRSSTKVRKIDKLLDELEEDDTLIVYELSRIGRSLGQIVNTVNTLIEKQVRFISIKEDIYISGTRSLRSKVTVGLFGIFADIERDLISQRTRQGLIAARLRCKVVGRPKGSIGKSKLDSYEEQIKELLDKNISKISKHIARFRPNYQRTPLWRQHEKKSYT